MTDIKLDPDSLAVIVQQAVLDSITPEAKHQLVVDAIKGLLTVPKDDRPQYQRTTPLQSPLQFAFARGVEAVATRVVLEAVRDDEDVQAAIREVVHPLIVDLCAGNYDGLPEAIAEGFRVWLSNRDVR